MIKLKRLDDLLQSRSGYTINELQEELGGVAKDTVRKMLGYKNGKIKGIRHGVDWPSYLLEQYENYLFDENDITDECMIEEFSVQGKKKFRYLKDDFSIFNDELHSSVIENLLPMLERLHQIEGLSSYYIDDLEKIYEVIERQKDGKYKGRVSDIEKGNKIILTESKKVLNIKGYNDEELIPVLCTAISKKQALEITYIDPDDNQSTIVAHPYLIVESSHRWYLLFHLSNVIEEDSNFVKNNRINMINTIGIKRIQKAKIIDIEYIESSVDIMKTLDQTIGVSIESWEKPKKVKLVLEIIGNTFYFKTKPFIGTGANSSIDGNIYTNEAVIISKELVSKILSLGNKVKVIEPNELKIEIKNILQKSIENYNDND